MKIIHIIDSLATGGAEKVVVDLVEYGLKHGHEMSIVVLKQVDGLPASLARERGISVIPVGSSFYDPRALFRLKKITNTADIVHVHLFPALYWGALISRPKVFTEHSSSNNRMEKKMFKLFEKWAYSRFDRVIAISEGVERAISRHLSYLGVSTSVELAFNGTTEDFFSVKREISQSPRKIVIIGSLKPVKQHYLAIRAAALLDYVSLDIAGDGDLRPELELLVKELKIQDRVKFLGNVRDVPSLLSGMDLLLSTSKYEGLSTVVIEAQASGIPVVGPNVAGIRDVVVDGATGILYRSQDPEVIANAIEEAFSEGLYKKLATAARQNAAQYSIGKSFDAQISVYQSVLNDRA